MPATDSGGMVVDVDIDADLVSIGVVGSCCVYLFFRGVHECVFFSVHSHLGSFFRRPVSALFGHVHTVNLLQQRRRANGKCKSPFL